MKYHHCKRFSDSSKLTLLSFIRCLFEVQISDDLLLYQQIIPRLNRAIYLSGVTMTQLDCMLIGYFMALLLKAGGSKLSVYLDSCSIDDVSLGLYWWESSLSTCMLRCVQQVLYRQELQN